MPRRLLFLLGIGLLLTRLGLSVVAAAPGLLVLEDYTDAKRNRNGLERLLVDDAALGGRSKATQAVARGVMKVEGELAPGRGAPAFISVVSLLSTNGKPQDLSAYQGVRLRVRVLRGVVCVQVASSEVTNFDYHTSAPIAGARGEFREVRVPFQEMKRAWSEPSALHPRSITSVNLVSFSLAKDSFAYEVDELAFY